MKEIFSDQFYQPYILKISKNFESAVSFDNLVFTILPGQVLYMQYPFGHLYDCHAKTGTQNLFFI